MGSMGRKCMEWGQLIACLVSGLGGDLVNALGGVATRIGKAEVVFGASIEMRGKA